MWIQDSDFVFITYIHYLGQTYEEITEVHLMTFGKIEQNAPFHFCVDIGNYTGISATSYEDFLTGIKHVKAKSLSFHLQRGDFQKWVLGILKDKKLAKEIEKTRKQKLRGQALRNHLYHIVYERRKELTNKSR